MSARGRACQCSRRPRPASAHATAADSCRPHPPSSPPAVRRAPRSAHETDPSLTAPAHRARSTSTTQHRSSPGPPSRLAAKRDDHRRQLDRNLERQRPLSRLSATIGRRLIQRDIPARAAIAHIHVTGRETTHIQDLKPLTTQRVKRMRDHQRTQSSLHDLAVSRDRRNAARPSLAGDGGCAPLTPLKTDRRACVDAAPHRVRVWTIEDIQRDVIRPGVVCAGLPSSQVFAEAARGRGTRAQAARRGRSRDRRVPPPWR